MGNPPTGVHLSVPWWSRGSGASALYLARRSPRNRRRTYLWAALDPAAALPASRPPGPKAALRPSERPPPKFTRRGRGCRRQRLSRWQPEPEKQTLRKAGSGYPSVGPRCRVIGPNSDRTPASSAASHTGGDGWLTHSTLLTAVLHLAAQDTTWLAPTPSYLSFKVLPKMSKCHLLGRSRPTLRLSETPFHSPLQKYSPTLSLLVHASAFP